MGSTLIFICGIFSSTQTGADMKLFTPYKIKDLALKNRIVLPPMCMYCANTSGYISDFHYIHYGARAVGGVGLIIVEATGVSSEGRISDNDLGIWEDGHVEGLQKLVKVCKPYGAKMAIQLGHAGRKCEADVEEIYAPSGIAYNDKSRMPVALSVKEIKQITYDFREAARRAKEAGFDAIEIHGAHGYLISEFLSPLSNKREDEYGGSIENRARFLKEILQEIKTVWPEDKPILLRVSASDYISGGMDVNQMASIIKEIRPLIDILNVSSGGVVHAPIKAYEGYQVQFSEYLKKECKIPTIAVGLITEPNFVEEILNNEKADFVALGRELLRSPYWVLDTALKNDINYEYPEQYKRGFKRV